MQNDILKNILYLIIATLIVLLLKAISADIINFIYTLFTKMVATLTTFIPPLVKVKLLLHGIPLIIIPLIISAVPVLIYALIRRQFMPYALLIMWGTWLLLIPHVIVTPTYGPFLLAV